MKQGIYILPLLEHSEPRHNTQLILKLKDMLKLIYMLKLKNVYTMIIVWSLWSESRLCIILEQILDLMLLLGGQG